jgi:RHS repeat-associated protein
VREHGSTRLSALGKALVVLASGAALAGGEAIETGHGYNGAGLRASQTIDATTSYFYGPGGLPIEQITGEAVLYLHHDQQGSTRMVTGATGASEGTATYDSYGNTLGMTGSASTPLGYDAQYTSSDTGLIYLRARTYDPATAQFLTVDPAASITGAPYNYAGDNPVSNVDPTGLPAEEGVPCYFPLCGPPPPAVEESSTASKKSKAQAIRHGDDSGRRWPRARSATR